MNKTDVFFSLLRFSVSGIEADRDSLARLTDSDISEFIALAKRFDVSYMLHEAMRKYELVDKGSDLYNVLLENEENGFFRYKRLENTLAQIKRILSFAKINFVVLKGSAVRSLYPSPLMRMSADIDVLVSEGELDNATSALTKEGFTQKGGKGYHDISFYSEDGMHLELHYNLKENDDRLDRTLSRVNDYIVEGDGYEGKLTPEFFLFHLVTHLCYHFVNGGCGIRPFSDIWLYRHNIEYDESILRSLLSECRLEKFYDNVVALSEAWFSGTEHTETTRNMEKHILFNAYCGNAEKGIALERGRRGSAFSYIIHRIFMPYRLLKIRYPIVGRHPVLLPIFEVVRWVSFLFGKKDRVKRELNSTRGITSEQAEALEGFLFDVGI